MAKQKKRVNGIVVGQLRGFVARLERLAEDRAQIADDTKQVMAEAKAAGYETKIIRMLLRERARDQGEMAEEAEILRLYREALGMEGTPLAAWAEARSEENSEPEPEPEPEPERAPRTAAKKRPAKVGTEERKLTDDEIAAAQGLTVLDPATRAALAWRPAASEEGQASS